MGLTTEIVLNGQIDIHQFNPRAASSLVTTFDEGIAITQEISIAEEEQQEWIERL